MWCEVTPSLRAAGGSDAVVRPVRRRGGAGVELEAGVGDGGHERGRRDDGGDEDGGELGHGGQCLLRLVLGSWRDGGSRVKALPGAEVVAEVVHVGRRSCGGVGGAPSGSGRSPGKPHLARRTRRGRADSDGRLRRGALAVDERREHADIPEGVGCMGVSLVRSGGGGGRRLCWWASTTTWEGCGRALSGWQPGGNPGTTSGGGSRDGRCRPHAVRHPRCAGGTPRRAPARPPGWGTAGVAGGAVAGCQSSCAGRAVDR